LLEGVQDRSQLVAEVVANGKGARAAGAMHFCIPYSRLDLIRRAAAMQTKRIESSA
jgi:flagellar motor switch protein FliM